MSRAEAVGLVPAAGVGRRLGWWASKELFPVVVHGTPVPVCRFALDALARGGITRALVVLSDAKSDLVRVLSDGADTGLTLGYAVQTSPDGLPAAVRAAAPWLGEAPVALVLPDTLFAPRDAVATLRDDLATHDADVSLAVFPTDRPEALAPVRSLDGAVLAIQDKPTTPIARNTWGAAVWSPRFTRFCAAWDRDRAGGRERSLSAAFDAAREDGLRVRACEFPAGTYVDAGTPEGLRDLQALADRWSDGPLIGSPGSRGA